MHLCSQSGCSRALEAFPGSAFWVEAPWGLFLLDM
jgi:hypothetical protein